MAAAEERLEAVAVAGPSNVLRRLGLCLFLPALYEVLFVRKCSSLPRVTMGASSLTHCYHKRLYSR